MLKNDAGFAVEFLDAIRNFIPRYFLDDGVILE
jgi:hypothetical protein